MKKTVILLLLYFCGMACVVQHKNKVVKSDSLKTNNEKIVSRKIGQLPNATYLLKTEKTDSLLNLNDIIDTAKIKNTPTVLNIATHGFFIPASLEIKRDNLLLDTLNTKRNNLLSDTLNTKSDILVAKELGYFNFSSSLISLSLVDSTVVDNWDNILKGYKSQYEKNDLLLLIAAQDSEQKAYFVVNFYQSHSQNNDISKAYKKALRMTRKKYGKKLDFRHYFHKAKTN